MDGKKTSYLKIELGKSRYNRILFLVKFCSSTIIETSIVKVSDLISFLLIGYLIFIDRIFGRSLVSTEYLVNFQNINI